jgi:hypothetical protein
VETALAGYRCSGKGVSMLGPSGSLGLASEPEAKPRIDPFPHPLPLFKCPIRTKNSLLKVNFYLRNLYKHLPLFEPHPMEEYQPCPGSVDLGSAERQNGKMRKIEEGKEEGKKINTITKG